MSSEIRYAVVCSSNMNRSMEAHSFLQKKGFNIRSYGTGEKIKIPGSSAKEPNQYPFGTSYDEIYADLTSKDKALYTKNGMLHIMERNRRIKRGPEKFQETSHQYDIILTVEEKVYDQVLEDFSVRGSVLEKPVHVINMNVVDNPEDATIGAFLLCDLVQELSNSEDLDNDIEDIIQEFESKCEREVLHTVLFY
ncbi:RNA polymerase II subunit A C-terminal domain phosphatase SSU72 [Eurytemora carolleeae]|uniref:RNA polymerase II subunit A C-terminal domain phosphatase SSU72 n=1 Tax=Eurytemora carolleeae TaxID=1294199 RepID=UPI000C784563|nr:RNA polymerase II subunit A C-terminal domain phosphatase SSU72 [Eurytemora carolleeae]|eukprot:XP_023329261.1 RNA polymerase II subunit A C-terminal domain phosphatase SSU72-like [Eurytemora affinis]